MEKLAAAIEKLEENDLLPIIKIILDNQTQDMYVKTDVEGPPPTTSPFLTGLKWLEGEFQFDLYTLGNNILNQLWEYTRKKVEV